MAQLDSRCTHFIGLSPLVVVASAGPLTDTRGGPGMDETMKDEIGDTP